MKGLFNLRKKIMLALVAGAMVTIGMLNGCKCPDCPPVTPATTESSVAPTKAAFHHLRMDKAYVVSSLSTSPSDFKKLVMGFKVNDYNHFPDSLTLAAYTAKNNDEITVTTPYVLGILPEADSLTTDLTLSTQEFSRAKLVNLVGPAGTSVTYDYLVFIPYVKDSVGRKFLSYRVEFRPRPGGGTTTSESTNPCPPFKPE
jgi:hypothetical protein